MTKVYIVTEIVEHERETVCGVFVGRDAANAYANGLTCCLDYDQNDYSYNVTEWELR